MSITSQFYAGVWLFGLRKMLVSCCFTFPQEPILNATGKKSCLRGRFPSISMKLCQNRLSKHLQGKICNRNRPKWVWKFQIPLRIELICKSYFKKWLKFVLTNSLYFDSESRWNVFVKAKLTNATPIYLYHYYHPPKARFSFPIKCISRWFL